MRLFSNYYLLDRVRE